MAELCCLGGTPAQSLRENTSLQTCDLCSTAPPGLSLSLPFAPWNHLILWLCSPRGPLGTPCSSARCLLSTGRGWVTWSQGLGGPQATGTLKLQTEKHQGTFAIAPEFLGQIKNNFLFIPCHLATVFTVPSPAAFPPSSASPSVWLGVGRSWCSYLFIQQRFIECLLCSSEPDRPALSWISQSSRGKAGNKLHTITNNCVN